MWKHMRSRWPLLSKAELRVVIRSTAARERNKARHTRVRHRSTRLAAVEFYRERFGEDPFLAPYSAAKLPPLDNMWLPGGYAWWKYRIHRSANDEVGERGVVPAA
jgi:hypothetical protein